MSSKRREKAASGIGVGPALAGLAIVVPVWVGLTGPAVAGRPQGAGEPPVAFPQSLPTAAGGEPAAGVQHREVVGTIPLGL